jgi:hypothetical protein
MCTPAEPTLTGQPLTLTSSGGAPPIAAASTKLLVVLLVAPAVALGSAVPAESAAATTGEPGGSTVRLICVGVPAATATPGSGKTAATAPSTTISSAAPAPPVALRRARVCELITYAGYAKSEPQGALGGNALVVVANIACATIPPAAPASSVTVAATTSGAEDAAADVAQLCGRFTRRCEPSVKEQLSSATGTEPVRPPAAVVPKLQ